MITAEQLAEKRAEFERLMSEYQQKANDAMRQVDALQGAIQAMDELIELCNEQPEKEGE